MIIFARKKKVHFLFCQGFLFTKMCNYSKWMGIYLLKILSKAKKKLLSSVFSHKERKHDSPPLHQWYPATGATCG